MNELDELLLPVFEALRRRRVPLGIPDYVLAVETISNLWGIENMDSIQAFCRLIWAKSYEDQLLFDETFSIERARQQQKAAERERQQTKERQQDRMPQVPKLPRTVDTPDKPAEKPPVIPEKKPEPQKQPQSFVVPKPQSQATNTPFSKSFHYGKQRVYHLTPRPPMDKRDMAGIWRKLRRLQQEGFSEELDVQATTNIFSRTGFLLHPVLQVQRRNQARLLLLLDQGGSMEPFKLFIDALLDSILRSGSLKQVEIFYFHDAPEGYLYTYPNLLGARSVESILTEYGQSTSVLIVGDAGAARGHYDSIRVKTTHMFLEVLGQYTYLSAWLNPVPKMRWRGSSAGYIAQQVSMFQVDWEGLNDAVNVLRGQSFSGAW